MRRLGFIALVMGMACNSSSTGSGFPNESFIEVEPSQFGLPCSREAPDGGRALVSYVATLVALEDDAPDAPGAPVLSSPPTPCTQAVRFAESSELDDVTLEVQQPYAAEILGFDRGGLSARVPGQPGVEVDGDVVEPIWSGSCGRGGAADAGAINADDFIERYFGPQYLVPGRTVTLRGCTLSVIADGD